MTIKGEVRRFLGVRVFFCTSACALLLLLCAATSIADEETKKDPLLERFDQWKEDVKSHKKAKHFALLQKDLKAAIQLYRDAESNDELRLDLVNAIGALSKGGRGVDRVTAVLHTLADIGDLRGGKYIKSFLKQANPKKASDLLKTAVASAADVPDQSLVEPLLKIVDRSKVLGVAGSAVDSLGRFGACKSKRAKILDTLIRTTKRSKPGKQPRMASGRTGLDGSGEEGSVMGREGAASARWGMLTRAVPSALNMLTGQDFRGYDEWFAVWKDHKSNLKSLFIKE